jgi:glycosyltransferase involved in cell wall biosynthesis
MGLGPTDFASQRAFAAFVDEYGAGSAAPVVVVIPAYNEEECVAAVAAGVPKMVSGLETEVIVVDDGSGDETSAQARAGGALVCRLEHNCGQGAAFRLGYRLAVARGARYIATVDADGQSDPAEIPALLEPVLSGRADFANGSRRLGTSETRDRVRKVGVVVFATLVSVLVRRRITDPANGLRAFRSEVVETVPLRQSQYQSSELLIGAVAHGFHVVEVPVVVRERRAGTTKKGGNLVYGMGFGRAVLITWWTQRGAARRRWRSAASSQSGGSLRREPGGGTARRPTGDC